MRVDVGVDASGVIFEAGAIFGGKGFESLAGGCAQAEDALLFVALDEIGAENFCQLSGGVTAHAVHLPEAVLSGDVSLSEKQVVEIGGFDGRNAVIVSGDGYRCR